MPKTRKTRQSISDISEIGTPSKQIFPKYDQFNTAELRFELQKFNLSTNGNKIELRTRLLNFFTNGFSTVDEVESETNINHFKEVKEVSVPIGNLVHKWNHVFNGKSDAVAFLERLEELQQTHGLSDKQLFMALPEMLRDDALMWYRNNVSEMKSWDDFLAEFRNFYLPADYFFNLEGEIHGRKQRENENGRQYITALQTLIRRRGGFSKEQTLFQVYNNLRPEYRLQIQRNSVSSLSELIREIDDFEKIQQELKMNVHQHYPQQRFYQERRENLPQNYFQKRQLPTRNYFPERDMPVNNSQNPPRNYFQDRQMPNNQNSTRNFTQDSRLLVRDNIQSNFPNRKVVCYRCGVDGHTSNHCENPRKVFCIICRKEETPTHECCKKPGNEMVTSRK